MIVQLFTSFLCLLASANAFQSRHVKPFSRVALSPASSTALASAELVDAFIPIYTLAAPAVLASIYSSSLPAETTLYEKVSGLSASVEEAAPAVVAAADEEEVDLTVLEMDAEPAPAGATAAVTAVTATEVGTKTEIKKKNVVSGAAVLLRVLFLPWVAMMKSVSRLLHVLYLPWIGMLGLKPSN